MTKSIRIENADNSNWDVEVQVWSKGTVPDAPDTLSRTLPLSCPTAMITEYVHSGQYLVVREKAPEQPPQPGHGGFNGA